MELINIVRSYSVFSLSLGSRHVLAVCAHAPSSSWLLCPLHLLFVLQRPLLFVSLVAGKKTNQDVYR